MGRCVCILASGPRKDSQCSNQAKPGSQFCGVHKNCKKIIDSIQVRQRVEPQESQEKQRMEKQRVEKQRVEKQRVEKQRMEKQRMEKQRQDHPVSRPGGDPIVDPSIPKSQFLERETQDLFPERCPPALRPIDGQCPPKFPHQRRLNDGTSCCWTSFKRIRKASRRDDPLEDSLEESLRHPLPSTLLPSVCTLKEWQRLKYFPDTEIVPARHLRLTGTTCDKLNQSLLTELPQISWIRAQREYLKSLKESDLLLVKFYTSYGDHILNNFIRHRWTVTEEDFDLILLRFEEIEPLLRTWLSENILKEDNTLEEALLIMYNRFQQLIINSPVTSQRFVCYRGSQTKDYFDHYQTLFQSVGFFSTSLLIVVAQEFSKGKFMTRIIVPEGYHCLYLESISKEKGEEEILMPALSQYFVTEKFKEIPYGRKIIPTNELVMVQSHPKPLPREALTTQHSIQDLIFDKSIRQQIWKSIDVMFRGQEVRDNTNRFRLRVIWLRRLGENHIYTNDDFHQRGMQLQPQISEI